MSMVDEYVAAANEALQSDNLQKIDSVAREIAMVFCGEIPNLSHYGVAKIARNGSAPYVTVDLKKAHRKTPVFQEAKDVELYSEYGSATLTSPIRQPQNADAEDCTEEQLERIFSQIDNIDAVRYSSYAVGLCDHDFNDDAPDESQAQLRVEKPRDYRDKDLRKSKIAQLQAAPISSHQSW